MNTRTTRLPVDLLDSAAAAGLKQQRSASKQIEHWARFGMYLEGQATAARRRVLSAVAGDASLAELRDDERTEANAIIDASISTTANESTFAGRLAARGVTTIVMDIDGRMIRRHPDGSTTVL